MSLNIVNVLPYHNVNKVITFYLIGLIRKDFHQEIFLEPCFKENFISKTC